MDDRIEHERDYWNMTAANPMLDDKHVCHASVVDSINAIEKGITNWNGVIVDLGCGVGRIALPLASRHPEANILGVDISPSMIHQATLRTRDESVRWVVGDGRQFPQTPMVAVYSMALFQHLSSDVVVNYMTQIAGTLVLEGVLRVQFVTDAESGPFSFCHTVEEMSQYATCCGLEVKDVDVGLIEPNWAWLTAVKL